jgi:uroporphyrinogen decarboxylase
MELTPRERVKLALSHIETDRIPIDFGGRITGIALGAYKELKKELGIRAKDIVDDKRLQLARVDQEVLELFSVDTRYIYPKAAKTWNPKEEGNEYTDDWGVRVKMPEEGFYYDYIDFPIKKPTLDSIEKHLWPDINDLSRVEGLKEEAEHLYYDSPYALITTFRGVFEQAWPLRGLENFLMDMLMYPEFTEALLDKVLTIEKGLYGALLDVIGPYLELVCFTDDLGTQLSTMISPELYRKYIKPRHKELIDYIRNKTNAKIALHSCGSVATLIDDFIEIGIDVLNPVQATAVGMDTEKLKLKYGNKISFWGSVDTQKVLPFKNTLDVENEVKKRITDLSKGGGFLFAPCHDIQANTPPQNIITMFKTAVQEGFLRLIR